MWRRSRTATGLAVLTLTLTTLASCYHVRVVPPGPPKPATVTRTATGNAFFWGLLNDPPNPIIADNCSGGALQEVRASTNFGYALISVLTLGIWVPLDIEWTCAKTPPPEPPIGFGDDGDAGEGR